MSRPKMLTLERDCAIRDAEDSTYAYYGLARSEKRIAVNSGFGEVVVRVSTFDGREDVPPVVLLHGIGSATVLAAPFLRFLKGRRVIAIDWPGHGLSEGVILPMGVDMRTHATSVIRSLLDALDYEQVDLVGHSMGAQFALYGGLDLGPRVRRLVVLGAPGAGFVGIRPLPAMKLLARPRLGPLALSRPPSDKQFDRFNDLALGAGALERHSSDLRLTLRLLADRTENGPSLASFFRGFLRRGAVRPGIALDERELGRITQPTLVIWGDEDVFLKPLEAARSVVAIRDAHSFRLAGAGHAPWLQDPYLVGTALARHLDD
ncbi:MAG TPA: alpha/beta hydrolase [Nocardioidaceae bacterium]|nr:alpha/beta hydrolase [Nocardioidaceae bacterium]